MGDDVDPIKPCPRPGIAGVTPGVVDVIVGKPGARAARAGNHLAHCDLAPRRQKGWFDDHMQVVGRPAICVCNLDRSHLCAFIIRHDVIPCDRSGRAGKDKVPV